ncbi:SIS domain-containing protein [Nocardioides terrisoli]|uniref:SIS domain-containing protein n=1 Tax=Nocardioides terrisoli TaxID=3388267 RepID=UPI00287B8288|nr:SIS domain-containing protein [Nocardioides marmorisolisilvae]
MSFDDGRLDDEVVLDRFDQVLRRHAEAGARVRRESVSTEGSVRDAVMQLAGTRPRAVVAAGPDSRLLRAVLEPVCPVPFLAWPGPGLPGWSGSLDLVVVLAPRGNDVATARVVAEAVRRGCPLVVACPADSLVAGHAAGRYSTVLPTTTGDQLATAVVMLDLLDRLGLAPATEPERVATALDDVAVACAPRQDLAVNPAKILAIGIADANPLLWGGTVLAARAARRIAESVRRVTGRTALAADAEHLLPVIRAAVPRDVFADPVTDSGVDARPALVVLEDGLADPAIAETRDELVEAARGNDVRVETVATSAEGEVCRYAALLATGTYAATYLQIGEV